CLNPQTGFNYNFYMKKFLLTLVLFVAFVTAYAQNAAVSGTVQSPGDNSGLPGAGMVLTRTDDQVKTGTATDMEGKFRFESVKPGEYTIEINFLGFKKFTKAIRVD